MEIVLIALGITTYFWGRPAWKTTTRAGNWFTNLFRTRVGRFAAKGCLCYFIFCFAFAGVYAVCVPIGIVTENDDRHMTVVAIVVFASFLLGIVGWRFRKRRIRRRQEQQALEADEQIQHQRNIERQNRDRDNRLLNNLRSGCEAAYLTHGPEISERFSRASFDEFLKKYLNDSQSLPVAELRAKELHAIIQSHVEKREPVQEKASLENILATFDMRRKKVTAAGLEAEDEALLLIQLNDLRDEAIRKAVMEGTL